MNIDSTEFRENVDDISVNLQELKENILKNKQVAFDDEYEKGIKDYEYIKDDKTLLNTIKDLKIPADTVNRFIKKYKDYYNVNKIPIRDYDADNVVDNKFAKDLLGAFEIEGRSLLNSSAINNDDLLMFFYIKEISGDKYNKIFNTVNKFWCNTFDHKDNFTISGTNSNEIWDKLLDIIKEHQDDICDYFSFCDRKNGDYKDISEFVDNEDEKKYTKNLNTSRIFEEIFVQEPESINLYNFLKENPLILKNLGGKVIDNIDLNIKNGINFCFRGILEMAKSRPDIEFPHLNKDPSKKDKQEWKESWKKIIQEYEEMLRNYISSDFIEDNNGKKIQKPKNETFDKIFYSRPIGDNVLDSYHTDESTLRELTQNEIFDYSFKVDQGTGDGTKNEETELTSKNLLSDIESYVKDHSNEKILICIDQHGFPGGSSGNGWKKEDWIKLANLSPNIKIWSIRCYLGEAFDNNDIFKHESSVSGFSNHTPTLGYVANIINEAGNLGLGFHEMEIYTRLNYPVSVTPLTESMEYTNWNTGETEIGKVGLAQNNNKDNDSNVNYA